MALVGRLGGFVYLGDAAQKGFFGQFGGTIHRLAIVLGAPAGTVNVDMLGVQAERLGLNHVSHFPVQHAYTYTRWGGGVRAQNTTWEKLGLRGLHKLPEFKATHTSWFETLSDG